MGKNKIVVSVIGVIIIAASFYAGIKYDQSKNVALSQVGENTQRSFNGGARQARTGQATGGPRNGGGFVSGEIVSKDDKSIVLKLRDGGSKIIFFSNTTQVMKSDSGSVSDLVVGEQVSTIGTANSDGSITAESVQIRPTVAPAQ